MMEGSTMIISKDETEMVSLVDSEDPTENTPSEVNSLSSKRQSNSTLLFTCKAKAIFRAMILGVYLLLVFIIIGFFLLLFSSPSQHYLAAQLDNDDNSSLVSTHHGLSIDTTALRPVSSIAKTQIEHYRSGTGLILNIHLTHHGGTTMCSVLGNAVDTDGAPGISCLQASEDQNIADKDLVDWPLFRPWRGRQPWSYNETSTRIAQIRKYFHFVAWESYVEAPKKTPLAATNYEHPNLISIYVTRDPLSRLLAGDAWTAYNFPTILQDPRNASLDSWWEYARSTRNVDNFALRILAGHNCCNGSYTDPSHLEFVKTNLLDRFTFILDIGCLDAGMDAVANLLGFTPNFRRRKSPNDDDDLQRRRNLAQNHYHAPPSERIPAGVYEYLVEKNRLSIELHEYAVNRSLIKCSEAWDV